jgi:archaellum component FlaC
MSGDDPGESGGDRAGDIDAHLHALEEEIEDSEVALEELTDELEALLVEESGSLDSLREGLENLSGDAGSQPEEDLEEVRRIIESTRTEWEENLPDDPADLLERDL